MKAVLFASNLSCQPVSPTTTPRPISCTSRMNPGKPQQLNCGLSTLKRSTKKPVSWNSIERKKLADVSTFFTARHCESEPQESMLLAQNCQPNGSGSRF